MAAELDSRCPICLDSWDDAAYVMPCLHRFCYACILRWADSKPECPLCKRRVQSIVHSVRGDDDFQEHFITPPAAPSVASHQAGGVPGHPAAHNPAATEPAPVEHQLPGSPLGGLQPHTWAFLFQDHPALLQLLLPWVQQELGRIFRNRRSRVAIGEDLVMSALGLFGLHEDVLVRLLRISLQHHTETFVQRLINVAVQRCSREARRLLDLEDGHAAEEREGSPAAAPRPAASRRGSPAPGPAPSGSPAGADEEERPSTSAAAISGSPSSCPDAPVPTHGEQEEPHTDPGQAVAGPSTASQGRDRSPGRPRRPPKRRAGRSQDSSHPPKRPPRHQN
ncbi:E3 ubiquitin-protein ligase Topors-like [Grus japonensis]|uniref:E3 ubiquitin-protein ligase Topors n=1 Tax=Grus japonensis TaxID=30415 RepID=A0ABC9Y5P2_GRUJA